MPHLAKPLCSAEYSAICHENYFAPVPDLSNEFSRFML